MLVNLPDPTVDHVLKTQSTRELRRKIIEPNEDMA